MSGTSEQRFRSCRQWPPKIRTRATSRAVTGAIRPADLGAHPAPIVRPVSAVVQTDRDADPRQAAAPATIAAASARAVVPRRIGVLPTIGAVRKAAVAARMSAIPAIAAQVAIPRGATLRQNRTGRPPRAASAVRPLVARVRLQVVRATAPRIVVATNGHGPAASVIGLPPGDRATAAIATRVTRDRAALLGAMKRRVARIEAWIAAGTAEARTGIAVAQTTATAVARAMGAARLAAGMAVATPAVKDARPVPRVGLPAGPVSREAATAATATGRGTPVDTRVPATGRRVRAVIGGALIGRQVRAVIGGALIGRQVRTVIGGTVIGRQVRAVIGGTVIGRQVRAVIGGTVIGRQVPVVIGGTVIGPQVPVVIGGAMIGRPPRDPHLRTRRTGTDNAASSGTVTAAPPAVRATTALAVAGTANRVGIVETRAIDPTAHLIAAATKPAVTGRVVATKAVPTKTVPTKTVPTKAVASKRAVPIKAETTVTPTTGRAGTIQVRTVVDSSTQTVLLVTDIGPDPLSVRTGPTPRVGATTDRHRAMTSRVSHDRGPTRIGFRALSARRAPLRRTTLRSRPAIGRTTAAPTGPLQTDPLQTGPLPTGPLPTGPLPIDPIMIGRTGTEPAAAEVRSAGTFRRASVRSTTDPVPVPARNHRERPTPAAQKPHRPSRPTTVSALRRTPLSARAMVRTTTEMLAVTTEVLRAVTTVLAGTTARITIGTVQTDATSTPSNPDRVGRHRPARGSDRRTRVKPGLRLLTGRTPQISGLRCCGTFGA